MTLPGKSRTKSKDKSDHSDVSYTPLVTIHFPDKSPSSSSLLESSRLSEELTLPLDISSCSSTSSSRHLMIPSSTRVVVKTLLKTLLLILIKLWKWSTSFLVLIFLTAFFYGGILPYALFVMAVLSLGYNASDYLLYQPNFPQEARILVASPQQFGLPFEEVWINTKDRVKLHAYYIKQMLPNSRSLPVLIFFHGNAGNIGSRLENAQLLHKEVKCHILLLEYRGYGRSEGAPSENGLYLDAQAAFEYIDARDDLETSKKVFLFGRSLGGAVAIDLASRCDFRDRVAGIIVENTFTSIPEVAKHLFPVRVVRWLPKFCFKNKYESFRKISSVVCPSLFISGTEDEMIPESMMKELFNRSPSSLKHLLRFPGGHNDTWLCDKSYSLRLTEFIGHCVEKDRRPPSFHAVNIV